MRGAPLAGERPWDLQRNRPTQGRRSEKRSDNSRRTHGFLHVQGRAARPVGDTVPSPSNYNESPHRVSFARALLPSFPHPRKLQFIINHTSLAHVRRATQSKSFPPAPTRHTHHLSVLPTLVEPTCYRGASTNSFSRSQDTRPLPDSLTVSFATGTTFANQTWPISPNLAFSPPTFPPPTVARRNPIELSRGAHTPLAPLARPPHIHVLRPRPFPLRGDDTHFCQRNFMGTRGSKQ